MYLAVLTVATLGGMALVFLLYERLRDRRTKERQAYRDAEIQQERMAFEKERAAREDERLHRQFRLEEQRAMAEEKRLDAERELLYRREMQEAEARHWQEKRDAEIREREAERTVDAGSGSGGYIFLELPEQHRPIFHDLLKGFEEYAQLKGYGISFSIDSTFSNKVAFKFTFKDDGVAVGTARVRRDFREYVERVRGGAEAFDDLPVIASLEEHEMLVTVLKNRVSFLQHSYRLSQNALQFYEGLFGRMNAFPALPAPSVVVQTGGNMDSRNYTANRSSRLIQGDGNVYSDSSTNLNIGRSLAERNERVGQLSDPITRLEKLQVPDQDAQKASRELSKVKDELEESHEPDAPAIERWLGRAKLLLSTAQVGTEVVEAGKKLFESFGLSG